MKKKAKTLQTKLIIQIVDAKIQQVKNSSKASYLHLYICILQIDQSLPIHHTHSKCS
jgi:hypothetical protein